MDCDYPIGKTSQAYGEIASSFTQLSIDNILQSEMTHFFELQKTFVFLFLINATKRTLLSSLCKKTIRDAQPSG